MSAHGTDHLSNLRSIPLFEDLDEEALAKVYECATSFEVKRGHVLIQPGQAGEGLFVVDGGSVTVELPTGRKLDLGPGEFVGELALLYEGAKHVARVSAATDLRCLAIRRDDFEQLLHSEPAIAICMLRVVARRLANTAEH